MKTNRIALFLIAPTLAAGLATGCGKKESAATEEISRALAVRVLPADVRSFERRLAVQGSLESKSFANVASRADGNLDAVWVDEGDAVVAGKTALFQIDSANRENALAIAKQDLAVANLELAMGLTLVPEPKTEPKAKK